MVDKLSRSANMVLAQSQFIRERCLHLIRKASRNIESWEMTLLDECHDNIRQICNVKNDEFPLISFYASSGNWTLYTTQRVIGESSEIRNEIKFPSYGEVDFGDFKQDLDSPRVSKAKMKHKGNSYVFLYESGYASMAPIYYFRFFSLKWPVWKKTFLIEQQNAEQKSTPNH